MKRLFDILFASFLLLVTWPLFLFAWIGIKLTSPGPAFYNARRVGRHGVDFIMHKFRSMHVNDGSGSAITAPDDERIFKFGGFLRASKIDELPQLLNILKGEMSFVGPRPEDPRLVEEHYADWMKETLEVTPGLTSPGTLYYAQTFREGVSKKNAEQSYAEAMLKPKLERDLVYVREGSFATDLVLIAKTAFLVLRKIIGVSGRE